MLLQSHVKYHFRISHRHCQYVHCQYSVDHLFESDSESPVGSELPTRVSEGHSPRGEGRGVEGG